MTIPNEPVKLAMTPIHDRPLKIIFKMILTTWIKCDYSTNLGPRISIEYEINAPKAISEANIIKNWLSKVSNQSEAVKIANEKPLLGWKPTLA